MTGEIHGVMVEKREQENAGVCVTIVIAHPQMCHVFIYINQY